MIVRPALIFTSWSSASEGVQDLTELSLEDLMNLKVTSVSKKEEAPSQAPAAVFVITRDGSVTDSGQKAADDRDLQRIGFRFDHHPSFQEELTVQGELYQGRSGSTYGTPTLSPPYLTYQDEKTLLNGGHLLGRFIRKRAEGRESHLQFYYDRVYLKDLLIDHALDTFNLEWQTHRLSIRSSLNLGKNIEANAWFRYVGALKQMGIGAYSDLDLRLSWRPYKHWEVSLVGQNLWQPRHKEFYSSFYNVRTYEVERSFYGKGVLKY